MARSPAASAGCGWLAGAVGRGERGRLGYQRPDLGVLLEVAGLQRGDLLTELRIIGIRDIDGCELLEVRDAPQLLAHMHRMVQVRPVAVKVLEHVHSAVLELPAELRAHDVRLHRGVGRPRLAKHLEALPTLLLAETGLVSRPVDVEDHGLLLLLVTWGPSGPQVSCRLVLVNPEVTIGEIPRQSAYSDCQVASWNRLPSGSANTVRRIGGR